MAAALAAVVNCMGRENGVLLSIAKAADMPGFAQEHALGASADDAGAQPTAEDAPTEAGAPAAEEAQETGAEAATDAEGEPAARGAMIASSSGPEPSLMIASS